MARKSVTDMGHKLMEGHPELVALYEMITNVSKNAKHCMKEASKSKGIKKCFNDKSCRGPMIKKTG